MPVGITFQQQNPSLPFALSDATGQTAFEDNLFEKMYQFPDSSNLKSPGPLLSESNVSLQSSLSLLDSMNSSDSEESVEAAVPTHFGLPDHSIFRLCENVRDIQQQDQLVDIGDNTSDAKIVPVPLELGKVLTVKREAGTGSSPVLEGGSPVPVDPPATTSRQGSDQSGMSVLKIDRSLKAPAPLPVPEAPISAGRTGCPETGTSMDLVPLPDLKPKRIKKTGRRQRRPVPYDKMTPEEVEVEKVDRLEKNRQSARDCRRRKKGYIQSLEERLRAYEEREANAQNEILQLRTIAETALTELNALKAKHCA